MRKFLVFALMMVMAMSIFAGAQAATVPNQQATAEAQATDTEIAAARACFATLKQTVAKHKNGLPATLDVPGCGTLVNTVEGDAGGFDGAEHVTAGAKDSAGKIHPTGVYCKNPTVTSKLKVGPVLLWSASTVMHTCWSDTGGNPIASFQNPPTLSSWSVISYSVTARNQQAYWLQQPTAAFGTETVTITQSVKGIEIGRMDFIHQLTIGICGTWTSNIVPG